MKAVNVDDVLKILYKYGRYIFVTDEKRYSSMVDEIANLKALEQEPCEDCISRQAVINGIDNYIEKVQSTGSKDDFISFEELVVKALPSVTPKLKTGHWIGHREHCENLGVIPSGLGAYKWCSNCDCGIDVTEWHRTDYNYCPCCSAKMESEE